MEDKKPTILVVDDTVENLDILVELLSDYDVRDVLDTQAALQVLEEEQVDLILLDIMMPDVDGFEFCSQLQQDEKTRDIPIIFITAMTDEASIEKAYDIGGKDYVTKPFKPKELLARVRMQLDLRAMIDDLEFIAFHDTLTGVFNRRKFFETAARKFGESDADLFAVMVDIDRFKQINDSHGHAVGDQVIQAVARAFASALKPDSVFGRLGGEEFALLCNHADRESVLSQVESMRRKIEQLRVDADDGEQVGFTVSSGIACKHDDMRGIDCLLKAADTALYCAKREGRNRTIFHMN